MPKQDTELDDRDKRLNRTAFEVEFLDAALDRVIADLKTRKMWPSDDQTRDPVGSFVFADTAFQAAKTVYWQARFEPRKKQPQKDDD